MLNWLSQVISVTAVNLRTIPERRGASTATVVGIAGVVAVFVGVLSIAEGFRADLHHSKQVLEASTVRGYRAPTFSIGRGSKWAHAILADEGFEYSSSVYPVRHDLYGTPGAPHTPFAPLEGLLEIPLTTAKVLGVDIPASGGGYFRPIPYALTRSLLESARRGNCSPAVFIFTPGKSIPSSPDKKRRRSSPHTAITSICTAPRRGCDICSEILPGRAWTGYSWVKTRGHFR